MKKITTILMMLIASFSFSQNNPIDFEAGGFGADWTWTVFENETNPPLEIIANPDQTAPNTSATVAKFTATADGNPWAGVESAHGVDLGTFEWSDDNRIVKIMVWKSVISDVGIKFATETGWAELELKVPNTVTNEWEELTFDFSNAINPPNPENGTLGQIIIFPDYAERDQDNIVYFDNITFHPLGDEPTDGPEEAAPVPTLDPANVISLFSQPYADVPVDTWRTDWSAAAYEEVMIDGRPTKKYTNLDFVGIETVSNQIDITGMTHFHIHVWSPNFTLFRVKLVDFGPDGTTEHEVEFPGLTQGEWVSLDISLDDFTQLQNRQNIAQLILSGQPIGTTTVYVDNVYFYNDDVEEGTDATLSDLQVDGTTVNGFSPSILNYSVVLPEGTTDVPVVTATTNDPDADAVITPADAIPGTTSVLVTSANGQVERTYSVAFSLDAGVVEGPRNPIDFEPDGYGADWTWTVFENETNPPLEIIANPDPTGINTSATVAKFTALEAGNPWAGVESAHGVDLGTFEWSDENRIVKIHVWKPVISNVGIKFATESGWAELELLVSNTVTNEWEELTFDFSNAINPPAENGTLGQIIIFPDFAERDQDNIVYFDNITFHPVGDEPTDGPEVAAPAPPARDPEDVVSVFSNAYTNVADTDFNPDWGQSTQVSIIEIEGNETLKYASFNYQGTQFASPLNVTEMESLHLDMWTADATSVNVFLISSGPVETPFALPITPNEWVSYDIPLTEFAGVDLEDVIQFKFDGGDGSPTIYLDNLYFYRAPTSVSDINQDVFTMFPNPVKPGQQVHLSSIASQLEVYDITGKRMIIAENTSVIETEALATGLYIVRIHNMDGAIQTKRLVVN